MEMEMKRVNKFIMWDRRYNEDVAVTDRGMSSRG